MKRKPFEKGSQDYRELKVSSNDNDLFLGGRTWSSASLTTNMWKIVSVDMVLALSQPTGDQY